MRLRLRIASGAIGLIGVLAMLAAPAGVAAATTTAATPRTVTTTVCSDGHWPVSVQGVPATYKAGAAAGDYIWHDSKGWHLRVTHAGTGRVVFTGTIRASAPIDADPVKLEKNDTFTVSADRMTISYRFVNYGHIDGIDFRTSCAKTVVFRGLISGHRLPTWRIWIGNHGRHPLENPFAIFRIR